MPQLTLTLHPSGDVWDAALACGDKAPNVVLSGLDGRPVSLGDLWTRGPLVLLFHPGEACGYCMRQIRKWKLVEDELLALGATVAVACLQDPGSAIASMARESGALTGLRDTTLRAACGFGIAVPLPADLARVYTSVGIGAFLPDAGERGIFPTAATYLIDRDGRIAFAHLAADLGQVDVQDLLAIVERLAGPPPAGVAGAPAPGLQ